MLKGYFFLLLLLPFVMPYFGYSHTAELIHDPFQNFVLRKLYHVGAFVIISFLSRSITVPVALAAMSEAIQQFIPERGMHLEDFLFNILGVLVGKIVKSIVVKPRARQV